MFHGWLTCSTSLQMSHPKMRKAMPNRKRLRVADTAALIVRARAGVICASDHVAAELLAATSSIARTIRAHAKSAKPVPEDRAITNILIDLRHYCDSKGLV